MCEQYMEQDKIKPAREGEIRNTNELLYLIFLLCIPFSQISFIVLVEASAEFPPKNGEIVLLLATNR